MTSQYKVTHPDKQRVRDLMIERQKAKTPPLSMEEIRRQLGWSMLANTEQAR